MEENEKISDNDTVMLCKDIIKKIETELATLPPDQGAVIRRRGSPIRTLG
jgi:hypothetical protein